MTVYVDLNEQSYDVVIENGVISKAASLINLDRKVMIVTDDNVPCEYSKAVAAQCKTPVIVTIPHGEQSKNFTQFQTILRAMLEAGFTRKDCVVAVGGGVIGDMSGFAASCYMRGIDFYNIPTTLLSQVDSSVGGKTAIDFEGVKNIIGAFYQPKKVLIDPEVLKTLDKRQLAAGLCEAIKMAATFDVSLFEMIENSTDLMADLPEIITKSISIKRDVVEKDAKEAGLRKVLNFGHTIGHGIESFNNGTLLHGECVGLGMLYMSSPEVKSRINNLLLKYNLPTECKDDPASLMSFILHDKKADSDHISTVVVNKLGSFEFVKMTGDEILKILENNR